jgi:hypothetical protein
MLIERLKNDTLSERLTYDTLRTRVKYDALIERLKYDTLFALDSARFRDRVREQAAEADLHFRRSLENATQAYMDLKLADTVRVPIAQQYLEMQLGLDRLQRQMGKLAPFVNDSISRINEGVAALSRQLESVGRQAGDSLFLSDSAAAAARSPGCSASGSDSGSDLVKLLVSNDEAARGGTIALTAALATESGAKIEFNTGLSCRYSRSGELRLYGRGAFDGAPIVVRASAPIAVVVMTGSGRILAGPMVVQNESRRFELTWSPR